MKQATISVPGKLYIAGEYAVVTPGHLAMLMTVNRFLTVTISQTELLVGKFRSVSYSEQPYKWIREDGQFEFSDWSNPYYLSKVVIQTVESYVKELNIPMQFYDIRIVSELDQNGKKIGLGSSGAVTIALIKALLTFYNVKFTDFDVYKLAAIAHSRLNSNGSFGDLAASAFTGMIAYSAFDKDWLKDQLMTKSITELLGMTWPLLHIRRVNLPNDLKILVGWTGEPASTENLVGKIYSDSDQMDFNNFLEKSHQCVKQLIQAFNQKSTANILALIQLNRELLVKMGHSKDKLIETPLLSKLCEVAETYGGSAKPSGAGGGDCGIAFIDDFNSEKQIIDAWDNVGIQALDLKIYQNGETDGQEK